MAFNPEPEYHIETKAINIRHFHAFKERYIVRPPYQRKTVWDSGKKQVFLDSLFRRYYIPSIVLREVRLDKQDSRREVIDGQQRISTVQEFYNNKLRLPKSLHDVDIRLPGKSFQELHVDIREFVDEELYLNAEIIKNIQDPKEHRHLKIASDIFWRLQQGEDLTHIEKAHARLTSLARNFLVKYANDYDFDFESYTDINPNPNKSPFLIQSYQGSNNRMEHLELLARFLLLERAGGPASIQNWNIDLLIRETETPDGGIGNFTYENEKEAKAVLKTLNKLHEVYLNDSRVEANGGDVPIFYAKTRYFIFSCYLLLRHLRHLQNHYVYSDEMRKCFREFTYEFFRRISPFHPDDENARNFVESRQQNYSAVAERDRIIRHEFFKFALDQQNIIFIEKDEQRAFTESQRIEIYLRDRGQCQMCLEECKPERECNVPWSEFEADHIIPWIKGGETKTWNGQVLCRVCNQKKGASYDG